MKRWPVTFALILPLAELCVALLVLTLPALLIFLNLETLAHGTGAAHIEFGQFSQTIPRNDFVSYATQSSSFQSSHLLSALNMPGFLVELLVSLPTSWPESWHPSGVSLMSWRSLIWPVFCLPAWLLTGCGVDALLGWRKLHWSVTLTGTILCLLFSIVFFAGIAVERFSSNRDNDWFIFSGLALWSLLFGTLPALWIRQWRARRNAARQSNAEIPA